MEGALRQVLTGERDGYVERCDQREARLFGPPSTFGEQAALRYAPDALLVHPSMPWSPECPRAFELGIVSVENSVEGAVNETVDLLIHDTQLKILDELVLPVEQCLLACPGTGLERACVSVLAPPGLGQCRGFIERI